MIYDATFDDFIKTVITECKRNQQARQMFGERTFFQYRLEDVRLPNGNIHTMAQGKKDDFVEKVRNHGATQKPLDNIELHGLIHPDYKVPVELQNDADGPSQSPGDYSVRDIMMKMKAGESRL
jgi:hypothetical protein